MTLASLEKFLTGVPVRADIPFPFGTIPPHATLRSAPIVAEHDGFTIRANHYGALVQTAEGRNAAWMMQFQVPFVSPQYRRRGLAKAMVLAYWRANRDRPLPRPPSFRTPAGAKLFRSVFEEIKKELV